MAKITRQFGEWLVLEGRDCLARIRDRGFWSEATALRELATHQGQEGQFAMLLDLMPHASEEERASFISTARRLLACPEVSA